MAYREEKMNLFDAPEDYALVHCISADFALGAGIAKQFQLKYKTRDELKERRPRYTWHGGDCLGTGTHNTRVVFNLVTKEHYWDKPEYKDLEDALIELKEICQVGSYTKLAMPLIGCGLDKLEWPIVKSMIEKTFDYSNIDILVCKL